jgi:ADP-ribose pyrophosphatase
MTEPKKWNVLDQRKTYSTRIFDIRSETSRAPKDGREHEFYVLEMPKWVNIIAETDTQEILFIRQYRHGTKDITLEIPGGMVDPEDENAAEGARRELLEETGYYAGNIEEIGVTAPNPAIQDNVCATFYANQLRYEGAQQLDSAEDIQVVKYPRSKVPELVASGQISHSLVVVAFVWWLGLGQP